MFNFSPVESNLLEFLLDRPATAVELLLLVQKGKPKTPKQTVYQGIRKLLKKDIVVVHKKVVSLNKLWISDIKERFEKVSSFCDPLLSIPEGKSIYQEFPNLSLAVSHWSHTGLVLGEQVPENVPLVFWNPHHFFFITNTQSEQRFFFNLQKQGKTILVTTGNITALDKLIRKSETNNLTFRMNLEETSTFSNTYYLDVYDDFIVETFLEQELADKIDAWFLTTKTVTEKSRKSLLELFTKDYIITQKVSRSNKRAQKLRARLLKDFTI